MLNGYHTKVSDYWTTGTDLLRPLFILLVTRTNKLSGISPNNVFKCVQMSSKQTVTYKLTAKKIFCLNTDLFIYTIFWWSLLLLFYAKTAAAQLDNQSLPNC